MAFARASRVPAQPEGDTDAGSFQLLGPSLADVGGESLQGDAWGGARCALDRLFRHIAPWSTPSTG
jgi:hypothetical protein